jgi:hypothetical protein
MKRFLILLLLLWYTQGVFGQKQTILEKGTVSYVSSQNVYVKFTSTANIQKGDTLFLSKDSLLIPALVVKDKSSTSCVCLLLQSDKPKVGDSFVSKNTFEPTPEKAKEKTNTPKITTDSTFKAPTTVRTPASDQEELIPTQKIKWRISAASYSNIYKGKKTDQLRYTLNFQGNNIGNSKFSTEAYVAFRHTNGKWGEVKTNFGNALKVYTFSVKYDFNKTSSLSLGRRINYRISSMGAMDGIQYEKSRGHFIFGVLGGWRPDYVNYGLNTHLFQAGAYLSHTAGKTNKTFESSLAFIEQHNHLKVDRRFIYFQHSNNLSKDLSLFASFEVDLYQNVNEVVTNKPSLTNLLISMRYRASKNLSFSASYDNRKNIIYYESYKSYIEQLIDNETRQGLRVGANYRLSKLISLGFNVSWRFQKSDLNLSKNINTYLNISRIPGLNASASISANLLQTNYLDSKIYTARITKDLVRNKVQVEGSYRFVDYNYKNYENKVQQHTPGVNLSWTITRKLALYLYYEGTFDAKSPTYHRFNTRIIQRF